MERMWDSHLSWCMGFAAENQSCNSGPEEMTCLAQVEREYDNLRVGLTWSGSSLKAGKDGLCLAGTLGWFWVVTGRLSEGRKWLQKALEQGVSLEASDLEAGEARAHALSWAGALAVEQGEYALAQGFYEEGLTLRRHRGELAGSATILGHLGKLAFFQGKYPSAHALYAESLTLYRQIGDRGGIANILESLGKLAMEQGEHALAQDFFEQNLTIYRQIGNQRGIAFSLDNLGALATLQGKFTQAWGFYKESLTYFRQLRDKGGIALALALMGNVALTMGNLSSSRSFHEEALAVRRELGLPSDIAYSLTDLGNVSRAEGNPAVAQRLYTESLSIWREIGERRGVAFALAGLVQTAAQEHAECAAQLGGCVALLAGGDIVNLLPPRERDEYNRSIATLQSALDKAAFTAAWDAGMAMTLEQAVEYAVKEFECPPM